MLAFYKYATSSGLFYLYNDELVDVLVDMGGRDDTV